MATMMNMKKVPQTQKIMKIFKLPSKFDTQNTNFHHFIQIEFNLGC